MHPNPSPQARYRLALFPLPVVLLPGAAMPLHVFEPRYRDLVKDRLEDDGRFGMVYHDWDRQGPFLSEEGRIGCVAQIRRHQALEDGRSLILVEGRDRFRISDGIESDALYFEALVSSFADSPGTPEEELGQRRRESIQLFHLAVASLQGPEADVPDLSSDRDVSFALARMIQVDPRWHQQLLELADERLRLDVLDQVFRAALEA